jgi:hypothetical protein
LIAKSKPSGLPRLNYLLFSAEIMEEIVQRRDKVLLALELNKKRGRG